MPAAGDRGCCEVVNGLFPELTLLSRACPPGPQQDVDAYSSVCVP